MTNFEYLTGVNERFDKPALTAPCHPCLTVKFPESFEVLMAMTMINAKAASVFSLQTSHTDTGIAVNLQYTKHNYFIK
jgi:hypothetical protein